MHMTHPLLALLATIISPLNYFIVKRAGYLSGLYGVVQNAALAESNQVAVEALGAVRTVQANTGEVGDLFYLKYLFSIFKARGYYQLHRLLRTCDNISNGGGV